MKLGMYFRKGINFIKNPLAKQKLKMAAIFLGWPPFLEKNTVGSINQDITGIKMYAFQHKEIEFRQAWSKITFLEVFLANLGQKYQLNSHTTCVC